MSRTLIISGHPNLAESNTNTLIIERLTSELEDVEVRYLDRLYPDFNIDVKAEQQALITADTVVLQFPFYWYSTPALLKKWLDDVFSYNFAYGAQGDKLKDKNLILSFTVGGPKEAYDPLGYNHFTIEQLIHPLQQTAYLAGMKYCTPVYTHQMVYIPGVYNDLSEVQARAHNHADRLLAQVNTLHNAIEEKVARFVKSWFAAFDKLTHPSDFFTPSLSEQVKIVMPEGEFIGHQGFNDWYQIARATFKPDCEHLVEQRGVKPLGDNQYRVELRIRLKADTLDSSQFGGDAVNILVNETWQVSVSANGALIIDEYLVEVV